MTNEEIINEFGTLFGDNQVEEPEVEESETEVEEPEESEVEESNQQEVDEQEDDKPEPTPEPEPDKSDRSNHAFAELRIKNKRNENLIKNLGKAIGLDDSTEVDSIADALQDYIIKKESEKTGVPEETLREIEELRALVNENNQLKIERETQEAFINLSKKYNIDSDGMRDFAQHLVDNDMNPLSGADVDVEAEYLKLHFQELLDDSFNRGVEQEKARREKVENHAGTPVPGSSKSDPATPEKIDTVKGLERYFDSLDL